MTLYCNNQKSPNLRRGYYIVIVVVHVVLACAGYNTTVAADKQPFQIASFSEDVTPPVGHALLGGLYPEAKNIVDPLYAKGFVLYGEFKPIVFISIDWCEIRNEAYEHWKQKIATAAGTVSERVLLSCVHQHDAPLADFEAQRLLDTVGLEKKSFDRDFHKQAVENVYNAVQAARKQRQTVSHLGLGQTRVEGIASNRRVVDEKGQVTYHRGSITPDEKIRNRPVGLHDPILKTLSFWNEKQCLVAAHFYAVHPMSYYGQGGVSSDFVGLARERLQHELPAIAQIYVSGCSGDVTAGKYNAGGEIGRRYLTKQMFLSMKAALQNTRKVKLKQIAFRTALLKLPPRDEDRFTLKAMRESLANPQETLRNRALAALGLSWRARVARNEPIVVPVIDFSAAQLLLLPGEAFVGYQLAAQKMKPDSFVCVAGYGECATGYIPTASAVRDGFDNVWYWVRREEQNEQRMHKAMKKALGTNQ